MSHLTIAERGIFALVRLMLPPQADNEKAADYLRITVGQDDRLIEWVVVRPDTLINDDKVTGYEAYHHQPEARSSMRAQPVILMSHIL
jgi:hypothetical protein